MAATIGAFSDLPMYSRNEFWHVNLMQCTFFRSAMKAAEARNRSAPASRDILAMSREKFQEILNAETDSSIRTVLILSWVTCGRLGDVAQLLSRDVQIPANLNQPVPSGQDNPSASTRCCGPCSAGTGVGPYAPRRPDAEVY